MTSRDDVNVGGLGPADSREKSLMTQTMTSRDDVNVGGLGQAESVKLPVDVLHGQTFLWRGLPAAQHDVVDVLRTDARPLQEAPVADAIYDLVTSNTC